MGTCSSARVWEATRGRENKERCQQGRARAPAAQASVHLRAEKVKSGGDTGRGEGDAVQPGVRQARPQ